MDTGQNRAIGAEDLLGWRYRRGRRNGFGRANRRGACNGDGRHSAGNGNGRTTRDRCHRRADCRWGRRRGDARHGSTNHRGRASQVEAACNQPGRSNKVAFLQRRVACVDELQQAGIAKRFDSKVGVPDAAKAYTEAWKQEHLHGGTYLVCKTLPVPGVALQDSFGRYIALIFCLVPEHPSLNVCLVRDGQAVPFMLL